MSLNILNLECIRCGKVNKRITRGYCESCYKFLRYHHIIENKKSALPDKLSDIQYQILTGSMLGDGNLYVYSTYPALTIVRALKDKNYLLWEYEQFKEFCISYPKIRNIYDKRTNKVYNQIKMLTGQSIAFEGVYTKWYCNDMHKKSVPQDLELTPLICAIWFCDDGSLCLNKNKTAFRMKLSTHGFIKKDVQFLIDKLSKLLGCFFSLACDNNHYYIYGNDFSTRKFISFIDKSVPPGMDRKYLWKNIGTEIFLNKRNIHLPISKNRKDSDLNKKEYKILDILYKNNKLMTSLEICSEMNWLYSTKKVPSCYNRYLNKFLHNGIFIREPLKDRRRVGYKLTEKGKEIYERISIDK